MFGFVRKKAEMVPSAAALPGRPDPIATAETHFLSARPLKAPVPQGMEQAIFGMGCFWGVERLFWQLDGVWLTMVGYAGGYTPNPTYAETCTGRTGHTEVVRVIYDPAVIGYTGLLRVFWEGHDPTQGMRQGNDMGTQYRSAIFTFDAAQAQAAQDSRQVFQQRLDSAGLGPITTEIAPAADFYYAEAEHQQYLAKNPGGYCGLGGTGVTCPIGTGV
ncbi:peptide-methionine (S)-S-oxide reductase MsrA [Actibacterium sp. D379-3]